MLTVQVVFFFIFFIASTDLVFGEAASMRDSKSVHSTVEEKGPVALASENLFTCNVSLRITMRWRFSSFREMYSCTGEVHLLFWGASFPSL